MRTITSSQKNNAQYIKRVHRNVQALPDAFGAACRSHPANGTRSNCLAKMAAMRE